MDKIKQVLIDYGLSFRKKGKAFFSDFIFVTFDGDKYYFIFGEDQTTLEKNEHYMYGSITNEEIVAKKLQEYLEKVGKKSKKIEKEKIEKVIKKKYKLKGEVQIDAGGMRTFYKGMNTKTDFKRFVVGGTIQDIDYAIEYLKALKKMKSKRR